MTEYLYIRLNEACNSRCFMCDFAGSRDPFRLDSDAFAHAIPRLKEEGLRYVRFTGGEPLLHKDLPRFIRTLAQHGIKSSVITNGILLANRLPDLAQAGVSQLIVSIDGVGETHDRLRGIPGLFQKCRTALTQASRFPIQLRVNTVAGPHNYADLPELQDILTNLGIAKWELSSLKLGGKLDYTEADRERIENKIVPFIYEQGLKKGLLVPFGKIWCGNSPEERDRYFATGITPRADVRCLVVEHVRFLDAKNMRLYTCPLTPHRTENEKKFTARVDKIENFSMRTAEVQSQQMFFGEYGPTRCTGCSSTAAGFSNLLREGKKLKDWSL